MLRKNLDNIFFIFLISHLIIWTIVPSISNINLPLDTIEHLAWSTNLSWGYTKHPPVIAVVLRFFYQIFGSNDWAYYFVSQLFICISFYFVWRLSEEFFRDKVLSILSVLLLELIIFHNYTSPEFNVYICQLPFKVLTVYFCWKSINEKNYLNWFLFGIFAALGFLTHYSFLYIILAIKFFFIIKIIEEKKFYAVYFIPGIIFFLILLPHLYWLYENNFTTISYALDRTGMASKQIIDHLLNPFIFTLKQIGILIPFFLVVGILIKKIKFKINFKDRKTLFLIYINLIPILLVIITSLITGAKIRTMWMSTFYLFFGILILYIFKKNFYLKNIKKFFFIFTFLFFISPVTYLYVSLSNDFKRTDYPGKEISRLVQNKWNKNFSNEIDVVIGDSWFAGNLSYHLETRPIWLQTLDDNLSKINPNSGFVYTGNPKVLKKTCPGVFGVIKPVGYCMIGSK